MNSSEYTRLRNLNIGIAVLLFLTVGIIRADSHDQTSKIVQARTVARHRECLRDNRALAKARKGRRASWQNYIDNSNRFLHHTPTAAELEATARFLKEQDQLVLDEFADRAPRPCTTAAENAYYARLH